MKSIFFQKKCAHLLAYVRIFLYLRTSALAYLPIRRTRQFPRSYVRKMQPMCKTLENISKNRFTPYHSTFSTSLSNKLE